MAKKFNIHIPNDLPPDFLKEREKLTALQSENSGLRMALNAIEEAAAAIDGDGPKAGAGTEKFQSTRGNRINPG